MTENTSFIDRLLFNRQMAGYLRSAHITVPVDQYMMLAILLTVLSALLMMMVGVLLYVFDISLDLIPFLPQWLTMLLAVVLIPAGVFVCLYYYPQLEAQGRKTKIEMDLPYAITYMQALSSTITLYDIFRSVYDAADLYGEVSKECGLIVRDVELFGEDLLTAMENTIAVTPSENFRELLNDLMLVYRSGGNLTNFFNAKSESYRELARQELEALLQFLEMIAEIYVTAFVAGPIAIIIMLVAQNLSGQSQMEGIMPLMYIGLPLGAVVLIFILYILLPPDNLDIARREVRDSEYGSEILASGTKTEPDAAFLKQLNSRKQVLRLLEIVKHPIKFFISDYSIGLVIGCILAGFVFLTYLLGSFATVFPTFTFQALICVMAIAAMFPLMTAYEIRRRYVNRVETQLPEFLREIADMRDIGMTLQGAIFMISGNKTGVLSSEVKVVSEELRYGSSLSGALVRMEERIGLVSVKRAISLLVKASEVTDYIREILTIAIADLEHYLKMKSKRLNVSFVYLAVIYLSFGIYLYSAYQMNVAFISSFSAYDISFDLTSNKTDMFHIGIILAFFSGIMAGQLSANSILCGLKHSIILLAATVAMFIFII
ncbi:type II secretion system F family protein [Methanocorpusculum vombati]|uniref:Type II secretion system F family protein n=1 Tax=Methanocorpusculum vombati TaxID=3002864 RepID=A0ABT4IJ31_9EURY|nr:type II secretion system F family protein [Methanocorpusculum vombati]MCZ9319173.1 type II secretion system F family protein [Methanocorpusculum sp.]MCZ0861756.1 type II secretion system F family protein [Methanocorpusculum vombati]MDE2521274.1 type II secretion system F family protein [Methanocorpusculum sp.]MDE2535011.1 type II secretion system F family protein [Methanocorpusculum sp.]MDE2545559.1 type II secretion system F family protein [Methanocorpusculum sp.]